MRFLIVMLVLAVSTGGFAQDDDAERRIINYIKENAKPDERLVLSVLYNEVFTTSDERAALDKLTSAFFRIPLFVIEFEDRQGRLPTLEDIAGQFAFYGTEAADVVLSVMQSDPRVPKFIERDPKTREITRIDIDAVKADERFNRAELIG